VDTSAIKVRILNNALSGGEKITRLGSVEGSPLLRKADLHIDADLIHLTCQDDVGTVHELGKLSRQNLKRIHVKKSVFTPGPQIMKPALNGLFVGATVAGFLWYRFGDRPGTAFQSSPIGVGILMALVVAIAFVVVNLGSIVWDDLAVVTFEGSDGAHVDIAIENGQADALTIPFAESDVLVESS
jgi:hypothetical protein